VIYVLKREIWSLFWIDLSAFPTTTTPTPMAALFIAASFNLNFTNTFYANGNFKNSMQIHKKCILK